MPRTEKLPANSLRASDFNAQPMLDYKRLQQIAETTAQNYQQAQPFPHLVIDDFISSRTVDILLNDYQMPNDRIKQDDNSELYSDGTLAQFRKDWLSMEIRSGVQVRRFFWELNGAEFLLFLQKLSGIKNLIPDPYRAGGGLHETRAGGFLMVHADYNRQPETDLDRRMNVIVYLNKDWQSEWGGNLELWTPDMKQCLKEVEPIAGRAVIFNTSTYTYHGHPHPLRCPEDRARKSISSFYYTNGGSGTQPHMTVWKKLPGQEYP